MKMVMMILGLSLGLQGGFFQEEKQEAQTRYDDAMRLCTLFTGKVEKYKEGMRDDELAWHTLHSYEKRAALYCKKAKEAKAEL